MQKQKQLEPKQIESIGEESKSVIKLNIDNSSKHYP